MCVCVCVFSCSVNEKEMKTRSGEIQRRYWIGQWWLCFERWQDAVRSSPTRQAGQAGRQAGRKRRRLRERESKLRRAVPFFVSLCLVVVTKKKKKG